MCHAEMALGRLAAERAVDGLRVDNEDAHPGHHEEFMTGLPQNQEELLPRVDLTQICLHGRMIEDVLTARGIKTGKVRCLECGSVFKDPRARRKGSHLFRLWTLCDESPSV